MKHLMAHWLWATGSCLAAQTIDLEQARDIDLDGLRGLGPATSRLILQERAQRPFHDWHDLMKRTPGIGPKKAAQLSEQGLRVQGQPYPPDPPAAGRAPDSKSQTAGPVRKDGD